VAFDVPPTLSPNLPPPSGGTATARPSQATIGGVHETAGPIPGSGSPDVNGASQSDPTNIVLVLGLVVALIFGTFAVGYTLRNRA